MWNKIKELFGKVSDLLKGLWHSLRPVALYIFNTIIDSLQGGIELIIVKGRGLLSSKDIAHQIIELIVNSVERNIKNLMIRVWIIAFINGFEKKLADFLEGVLDNVDSEGIAKSICSKLKQEIKKRAIV